MGAVFRMALEMDEKALLLLLDEAIDASLCRPGENGISAARESPLLHLVPPGVRCSEGRRNVVHQGMISRLRLSEDTDAFGRQLVALHTVHVQAGPSVAQTRINGGRGILHAPGRALHSDVPLF